MRVHFGVLASALASAAATIEYIRPKLISSLPLAKIAKVALAPGFSSSGGFLSNVAVILSAPHISTIGQIGDEGHVDALLSCRLRRQRRIGSRLRRRARTRQHEGDGAFPAASDRV
jgi:hypothetical protein